MSATPSRARRLIFRAAALLLAPALLLALELGLRAVGWPPSPSPSLPEGWEQAARAVEPGARGDHLLRYERDGEARVRTNPSLVQARFMHALDYPLQPAPGRFRVFCFGGSATLGVPLEDQPELTFPGRLEHHLRAAGLDAEVINLGGASFGSTQVLDLARAALEQGPSALVIYSGNNEFFEYALELWSLNPQGQALLEPGSPLRLVRALRRLQDRLRPPEPSAEPQDQAAAQQQLVLRAVQAELEASPQARPSTAADGPPQRHDTVHRAVMGRYAANLEAVAAAAAAAPSPPELVLVRVPANLLEPPWQPAHRPDLAGLSLARWERLAAKAQEALGAGRPEEAAELAAQAIAIDGQHAGPYHSLGLAQLALGRTAEAAGTLRAALELDMVPGRPLAAQGEALERIAASSGAHLVDPGPAFDTHSLARGQGSVFHDSCHLTAEGYDLLARHVAQTLIRTSAPGR